MAPSNETRQFGAAGLGKLSFPGGNDNRVYPTKSALNQAENTVIDAARQFRGAQARRRPVLTVQIGVRAANEPHGRSRPFSLSHDALDRLLDTAARLERRP
jgi:hypothetical protein